VDFRGYLSHLRREGDLIATVAPHGLDRPVPACPPWDVREVVAHLAMVYDNKVIAMRFGRQPVEGEWVTDEPFGKDTVEWFADEHAKLLAELAAHKPSDYAWTWWEPDQTIGFWARRMALETVVHRVDVESGFGVPTGVDAELAVDGIDEILMVMLDGDDDSEDASKGTVEVVAGDTAWSVVLEESRTVVTPGRRTSPGAVLSGDPGTLLLYLWGRAQLDAVTLDGDRSLRVHGNEALITAMRVRLAAATQ
jgi:uncharacterized protein (TIGR03083 family)